MNTKNFHKFLSISRPQSAHFYKFLSISIYFSLFLSIFLFAQQDNLEVKGTLKCDSLTIQGGTSDPSSPVKGTLFYRSDKKKFFIFDGENWQKIGGGGIDKTIASQIVGTASSKCDSDQTCDGTSDQEEIQQAIDDLGNNKGAVYLLEGTYNLDGSIALNNTSPLDSNKSIIGTGAGTMLKDVVGLSSVIRVECSNILFSQFRIKGFNNITTYIFSGDVDASHSNIIDTLWFEDIHFGSVELMGSPPAHDWIICESYFYNSNQGYSIFSGAERCIYCSNIFQDIPRLPIFVWGSGSIVSFNSIRQDISSKKGNLYSGKKSIALGNNVLNNVAGSLNTCSIFSEDTSVVTGNYASLSSRGMYSDLLTFNSLDSNDYGVRNDAKKISIFGNLIYESGAITGQGLAICFYPDVFNNPPLGCLISSNFIYDSAATGNFNYGIYINSGADTYLVGNLIFGSAYYNPTASSPVERRIYDNGTSTRYTDKLKITLQKGEYTHTGTTISLSGPASYLRLNPSNNITVKRIKKSDNTLNFSPGDILILENAADTYTVSMKQIGGNLRLHANSVDLEKNDTLTLLWDGKYWIEIGYSNN